jgi:ribokinase
MAKIIVVGSINMDLVVRTPHIPVPGQTVLGRDFRMFPGGKGANQAVAAARQGASVTLIGRLGMDAFGQQLMANIQNEGIDTRQIGVDPSTASGVALITVDVDGQNSIVVAPGANHKLSPTHIQDARTVFARADALLLQLEIPLDTVIAAAEQAKAYNLKVIINPAPAQSLPIELLSIIDVIIPNESETTLLTGDPVETPEQVETAARKLLTQGVGCVVVTLGEKGALLVQRKQPAYHVSSFNVDVVDTTAAGDSFVGTFSVALAERLSLEAAINRACAAGALATTRLGAQPSIPTNTEIDYLLKEK